MNSKQVLKNTGKVALYSGLYLGLPALAFAGDSGGGGGNVPWEGPLQTISDSLTGPVANAIALIGIVVAGGTLVFGGQLGDFARRAIMLALAVSIMVLAGSFLTNVIGATV